nr:phosphoribosylformylglycinamidine synthase subunit PurQ [Nesterenkonia sedimenti]
MSETPLIGDFNVSPSGPLDGARIGVITFPGTLDDRDAARAVRLGGGTAVPLWHADQSLHGVDAVILPGGFSYGDYLRAGAIARFAPVMETVVKEAGASATSSSPLPVLGICNGFQVLTEAHLLPGSMIKNDHLKFICKDQVLRVENTSTPWTSQFTPDELIAVPMKNQDGQYVVSAEELEQIEAEGRVVFRYIGENPNGSRNNIAGVTNERGNVVGLMPHPEHAVEAGYGPDDTTGMREGTDGLTIFTSVVSSLAGGNK